MNQKENEACAAGFKQARRLIVQREHVNSFGRFWDWIGGTLVAGGRAGMGI
jgi:hypothetical protein